MGLEDLFANAIKIHAREAVSFSHIIGTAINITDDLCDVTVEKL